MFQKSGIRAAAKATATAVKAIIAAVQKLITAIAASGWVVQCESTMDMVAIKMALQGYNYG